MALKECKECGKEISTSAVSCPHCGKKGSHFDTGIIRDILFVCLLVWIVFEHFKTEAPSPVTSPFTVSADEEKMAARTYSNPEETLDKQQAEFCQTISNYRKLYFNEYHKKEYPEKKKNLEDIFNERNSKLIEILGDGKIQGWKGIIRTITVEEGDGAWVEVNLPCNTRLESKDDMVIKIGTPLYESLTRFHDRSPITFSGDFLIAPEKSSNPSLNQTYLEETSFTPGGSMDSPEFSFNFNKIGK